jgi:hypothetical protein
MDEPLKVGQRVVVSFEGRIVEVEMEQPNPCGYLVRMADGTEAWWEAEQVKAIADTD